MIDETRPRSIGELLDRAIATYIRYALSLFVILAVVMIPIALVEGAAQPGIAHSIDLFNQIAKVPPNDTAGRTRVLAAFQKSLAPNSWVVAFFGVQFLLSPLANSALIFFTAGAVDGVRRSIGGAYRLALGRWGPQIAVAIAYAGITFVLCLVAGIAAFVAALALVAVGVVSRPAAIIAGIILAAVAFVAIFVVASLGNIAWLMSSISVVTEDANPVHAVARGLRRALDRPLIRRTTGAALAVLALEWFGTLAFLAFASVAAYVTHIDLISSIISACAGIVISGLTTVFAFFYMRDVKLRREGSDLLAMAGEPPVAAS